MFHIPWGGHVGSAHHFSERLRNVGTRKWKDSLNVCASAEEADGEKE